MESKNNIAVFDLGKLPISETTRSSLAFRFQEWVDILTHEKSDATPAFFAIVPKGTQLTPEFHQQVSAKYGWIPRYCGLIWDATQV
jgi:hypothetical protein